MLLAAMLVDTLGGGLLAPFELVCALKVASLSLSSAGVILSVAAAAGIAVGPVAGAAVDRLGPVRVVAIANGVGAAGCRRNSSPPGGVHPVLEEQQLLVEVVDARALIFT